MKNFWGGLFELRVAAKMLAFNFVVYKPNTLERFIQYHFHQNKHTIYLEWENFNHFNSLFIKNIRIDLKKSNSPKCQTNSILNSTTEEERDLELSYIEELQKKNDIKAQIQKNSKKCSKVFPPSQSNGDTYNKASFYLKYRTLPEGVSSKGFKDFKKYVSTHYRLTKASQNKYTASKLQFKQKNNINWLTIPYQDEIPNIIKVAHGVFEGVVIKHNGIKITKKKIESLGIFWNRMEDDITKFIKCCKQCINQSPDRPCNVPKVIESSWPLDRIVADNWSIPKNFQREFGPNQNYKYVLTCVDHFSKYKWCFLIPNKEPKTILDRLEIVFSTFTKPSIFQSDNGGKFKNQLVKDYCKRNKIEFINGRVRHPQSQGVVEKINEFISKSLKSSFEDYLSKKNNNNSNNTQQNWEIEMALMMFVINQNNKPHTVTNYAPIELVNYRSKENPEHLKIINQVKAKVYSYYAPKEANDLGNQNKKKKVKKNRLPNFKPNMKVFIIGRVKKAGNSKSIVKDNTSKLSKFEKLLNKRKIPALVSDVSTIKNNHIRVKIIGEPQHQSLKVNEIYDVHLEFIEPANLDSWQSLLDEK